MNNLQIFTKCFQLDGPFELSVNLFFMKWALVLPTAFIWLFDILHFLLSYGILYGYHTFSPEDFFSRIRYETPNWQIFNIYHGNSKQHGS